MTTFAKQIGVDNTPVGLAHFLISRCPAFSGDAFTRPFIYHGSSMSCCLSDLYAGFLSFYQIALGRPPIYGSGNMIQKLLISVLGFVASYVAAASLDLEGVGGDGAFTFTFDVAENSTVSSTKYYVPSIDKSSPVVVHETVTWTRGSPPEQDTPIAFTVLFSNDTTITGDLLSNLLSEYLDDDIYTGDFLEGMSFHFWGLVGFG